MEEGAAETFRVRFGDETAAGGAAGQDALTFEHIQLFGGASNWEKKRKNADQSDKIILPTPLLFANFTV